NALLATAIDACAELRIQGDVLCNFLTEDESGMRCDVCALTQQGIDCAVNIACRDRKFTVTEAKHEASYNRCNAALQDIVLCAQIERGRIYAFVHGRMLLLDLFKHGLDENRRIVLVAQTRQLFEVAAWNVFEEQRGSQAAKRQDGDVD